MGVNGIVRRIDELGRIVIPKELRRAMRLRVGDELEIFSEGDSLTIKKHSAFGDFETAAKTVCDMIAEYIRGCSAFALTADKIVAVSAKDKRRYLDAVPSEGLIRLVLSRSAVVVKPGADDPLFENVPQESVTAVVEPVLSRGDLVGAVLVTSASELDENQLGYVRFASAMLSAVLSD